MPKGVGFVEYERFQEAYESLKRATRGFKELTEPHVWDALATDSLTFLVLRAILGMTAPEWAYLASTEGPIQISQGAARILDKRIRMQRDYFARQLARSEGETVKRARALVEVACRYLQVAVPAGAVDTVHRLNKFDTADGARSVQRAADLGVPYAVVLYERYLGRPFANHRDSISELVGDVMESAVEARLAGAHVSFRKTKRAERIPGFEQAPDFMIPDEVAPTVVIEAKITSDDGTARDKVARLLRLVEISEDRQQQGKTGFEVVACIDGRGFGQRRESMRQLLRAVHGKVFTLASIDQLISNTAIGKFAPSV